MSSFLVRWPAIYSGPPSIAVWINATGSRWSASTGHTQDEQHCNFLVQVQHACNCGCVLLLEAYAVEYSCLRWHVEWRCCVCMLRLYVYEAGAVLQLSRGFLSSVCCAHCE